MSPRRPPAFPLWRGLRPDPIPYLQQFAASSDLGWEYYSPTLPNGLMRTALRRSSRLVQADIAEYWFRLNFVPFNLDRKWFTLSVSVLGGPDLLEPEHAPPLVFLEEEFSGAFPLAAIADLATRLLQESAEWSPVPPDAVVLPIDDPAAGALAALDFVEADLVRVGPGHNQGPPLDPATTAYILEQVRIGREAVASGDSGRKDAGSAASGLVTLTGIMGTAFAQGIAKKAGEDAEPYIRHGLAILLDHMLRAASALLHWIASIAPGPLL